MIERIRKAQHEFKSECDQADNDCELGRYAIGPAWTMWHLLDEVVLEIERLHGRLHQLERPAKDAAAVARFVGGPG